MNSANFGAMSRQIAGLIQQNVIDPDLRNWVPPNWSRTTDTDRIVASILMTEILQKYFGFTMMCTCGIPSVTLLGEGSDWEDMLKWLDKLDKLGNQPKVFASLLRPILRNMVASFDSTPSPSARDFWRNIAHYDDKLSGVEYLSGWITAFCFWNDKGKMLYHPKLLNRLPHGNVCIIDQVPNY